MVPHTNFLQTNQTEPVDFHLPSSMGDTAVGTLNVRLSQPGPTLEHLCGKTGAVTSSPAAGSPKRRVRERPRLTAVSPEVNKVGQTGTATFSFAWHQQHRHSNSTATYEDYLGPVIPDEDNHATEKLPLEAQLLLERERLSNAENWSRCQVKLILNLAKDLL